MIPVRIVFRVPAVVVYIGWNATVILPIIDKWNNQGDAVLFSGLDVI
jgi:hypothetical protein